MSKIETVKSHVSASAAENIEKWLTEEKYGEYKNELIELIQSSSWLQLEDSFFKEIEFGTGGIRGATGIGSNRINRVTIGGAAQALCLYAGSIDPKAQDKGVAIAYDTRLTSPELSRYVAQVCAANGFKVYLFESFRSTPELSFAVRELGCAAGIVISASHNPPEDNGFKAYWSDGGQLVYPHDTGVMTMASSINKIVSIDYDEAIGSGRLEIIGSAIDEKYIAAVVDQSEGSDRNIKIVYSPLHGAGQTNVLPALKAAGFIDVSTVKDQMVPDGNFPTVENGKPNPEEKAANDRAVAQMLAEDADIAITNDPDADRIGVVIRQNDRPIYLNGNQSAVLVADYVLQKMKSRGELSRHHYIAKTIVTTDMLDALATSYEITIYGNMLIGFKYIGELMTKKEATDEVFIMGGEESYGLLKGQYARDKDGAAGALPLAEYAAELKSQGKTLVDRLFELYAEHGLFIERLDSVVCPGANGFEQMQTIMRGLRSAPFGKVMNHTVTVVYDYQTLVRTDITTGQTAPIDCVTGDVVVLEFGDNRRRVTVRPSGTEPKLKLYTQWFEEANSAAEIQDQKRAVDTSLESLARELEGQLFKLI
jgi:phosphoglucomutase